MKDTLLDIYPTSIGQDIWARQYMRSLSMSEPHFWTISLRLSGRIFASLLKRSLAMIVNRHETLRTTLQLDDRGVWQRILPSPQRPLCELDLTSISPDSRESAAMTAISQMGSSRFQLNGSPLFRALLLRLAKHDYVLAITACEAICDGPSRNRLLGEIAASYQAFAVGAKPAVHQLNVQYRDFAIWQRRHLDLPETRLQRQHWVTHAVTERQARSRLCDQQESELRSFRGAQIEFSIPADLRRKLEHIASTRNATLFMVLAASLGVLLHLRTGAAEVVVGSTSDYREHSEFQDLIGLFASNFVIRIKVAPEMSFLETLDLTRDSALLAYRNRDYPLDLVLQELYPDRNLCQSPPFDLKLVLQDDQLRFASRSALKITPFGPPTSNARHDLTIALVEKTTSLAGTVTYSVDRFESMEAALVTQFWQLLLSEIAISPTSRLLEIGQKVSTIPLGC